MSLYNEIPKNFRPTSVMPICLKYEKQTFIQFLTAFFLQENGLRCSMETWQTSDFFVRKMRKAFFKFRQYWYEFSKTKNFGKTQRTLKNKFLTNIKKFSAQTLKMVRRNISVKNTTASKVSLDTWNEILTTLLKIFCQKTKHFLTAFKKQNESRNFCQKVYVYFEHWHGHKKSSFDRIAR